MRRYVSGGNLFTRIGTIVIGCLVVTAAVAVASAAGKEAATSVIFVNASGVPTLDFRVQTGVTPLAAAAPGYDKLVAQNPYTGKIEPYIATKWKVTPVNRPKQITFTLRRDAKCPSGASITPLVVMKSMLNWINTPKAASPLPKLFGNGPYRLSVNNKNWTFTFASQSPFSTMLLGFTDAPIVCPEGLAALAKDPHALVAHQYGSGPYEMTNYVPNVSVSYRKRANWSKWAKWAPAGINYKKMPDTFTWQLVSDASTETNMLATGQADLGFLLPGPNVARLTSNSSLAVKKAESYNPMEVWFNQRPGYPARDPKIRSALFAALNYKDLASAAYGSSIVAVPSFLQPNDRCYDKKVTSLAPKGDVAKAQQILKSAGYSLVDGTMKKGGQSLKVTLMMSSDRFGNSGVYIANQWKKVGVDVNLVDVPISTYVSTLIAGKQFDATEYIAANYRVYPWFQVNAAEGPTPPAGGNYSATGLGDQAYTQAGLFVSQRTDCVWAYKFQETMLKDSIALPVGFPISYSFAAKSKIAKFPADGSVPYPQWIVMK